MPFSDVADYSYEMFREFAAHGAQADELASTDTPVTPEESVTGDDSSSLVTTSTTAQQTDPTSVVSASTEPSATLDLTPSVTTSADASTGEQRQIHRLRQQRI